MSPTVLLRTLDRTGPPVDALFPFAAPLFEAYGVDVSHAEKLLAGTETPDADAVLLVVETARLLWAYCALPPEDAHAVLPRLEATLLPGSVRDDERAAFHVLLAELEEHFHDLSDDERAAAAPPFDGLLDRYRAHYPPEDPQEDEVEAMARFTQPLWERLDLDDPDAFDRLHDLGQGLWDAAHADDRAAALADLRRRFPDERSLAETLDELIARYRNP